MSHPASNPRLIKLITDLGPSCFPDPYYTVSDLEGLVSCSKAALHYYTTGRRDLPRLEEKIAKLFKLPIYQLRRRLGLPLDRRLPARPISSRSGSLRSVRSLAVNPPASRSSLSPQEKKPHAATNPTATRRA